MESKYNFKPYDRVLVRDNETDKWRGEFFLFFDKDVEYKYYGIADAYRYCIPFEGNEHLLGTTDAPTTPKQTDPNESTLFGIELKPGYVLEFDGAQKTGVVFPTKRGLAIAYITGSWQYIDTLEGNEITCIRGIAEQTSLLSGVSLWKKPPKQTLTKAEIAEKLGIGEQDFEIIEEENE